MDVLMNLKDTQSTAIFIALVLWSVFWKGLALWHASRRNDRAWFVIILVVSTLGIIEIIYLFFVIKLKLKNLFRNEKVTPEHHHHAHHEHTHHGHDHSHKE